MLGVAEKFTIEFYVIVQVITHLTIAVLYVLKKFNIFPV